MDCVDADHEPARVVSLFWSAWILAVAAGMILVGMVDDSPFVPAMKGNFLFRACWMGIEIGSIVAGFAIAVAGVPLAWSALRAAFGGRRRDILFRIALPFAVICALVAWIAAVLLATGGHWAAPPWAVAFTRPDRPSAAVRWTTGSISAVLLVAVLVTSVMSVLQILRSTEFPGVRLTLAGAKLHIAPLRFAVALLPWAAIGFIAMFVSAILWGLDARVNPAFGWRLGPLGLTTSSSWLLSTALFGTAAAFSLSGARTARRLRFDPEQQA